MCSRYSCPILTFLHRFTCYQNYKWLTLATVCAFTLYTHTEWQTILGARVYSWWKRENAQGLHWWSPQEGTSPTSHCYTPVRETQKVCVRAPSHITLAIIMRSLFTLVYFILISFDIDKHDKVPLFVRYWTITMRRPTTRLWGRCMHRI